jgi:hypothetical protein
MPSTFWAAPIPPRRHLIQLGFKHPHYNLECPDRFYQLYDPAAIRWPDIAHPRITTARPPALRSMRRPISPTATGRRKRAAMMAGGRWCAPISRLISHVDHEIGRFLDALRGLFPGRPDDGGLPVGQRLQPWKPRQLPQDEPVGQAAHVPLGIWSPRMTGGGCRPCPSAAQLPQDDHAACGPAPAARLGVGAKPAAADRPILRQR